MASYYPYLIASLPALQFGTKPPLTRERLFELCEGFIPPEDLALAGRAGQGINALAAKEQPTLAAWAAFERALRNELVKIRAGRRHADPAAYLRPDGGADPQTAALVMHAFRATTILEREKLLDEARWNYLDELAVGHYFDIDALIIYVVQLTLLERWERVRTADAKEQVAGLVSRP